MVRPSVMTSLFSSSSRLKIPIQQLSKFPHFPPPQAFSSSKTSNTSSSLPKYHKQRYQHAISPSLTTKPLRLQNISTRPRNFLHTFATSYSFSNLNRNNPSTLHKPIPRIHSRNMTTPSTPEDVMVIRELAPGVTTLSVPFLRFDKIKFGGRATIGMLTPPPQAQTTS